MISYQTSLYAKQFRIVTACKYSVAGSTTVSRYSVQSANVPIRMPCRSLNTISKYPKDTFPLLQRHPNNWLACSAMPAPSTNKAFVSRTVTLYLRSASLSMISAGVEEAFCVVMLVRVQWTAVRIGNSVSLLKPDMRMFQMEFAVPLASIPCVALQFCHAQRFQKYQLVSFVVNFSGRSRWVPAILGRGRGYVLLEQC